MIDRLLYWLFGALSAVLVWAIVRPADVPRYTDVIVPLRIIEQREPDTVIRWRERIVERVVQPSTTATAPAAATGAVEAFCRADTVTASDTIVVERIPMLLLRSGSLEQGRFFRPDLLTLTGLRNNGDVRQQTYTTRGSVSWVVNADSLIVRDRRWAIFGGLLEAGAWLTTGYVIGRIW